MTMLPNSSTVGAVAGRTTTVVPLVSTIAGPRTRIPGSSSVAVVDRRRWTPSVRVVDLAAALARLVERPPGRRAAAPAGACRPPRPRRRALRRARPARRAGRCTPARRARGSARRSARRAAYRSAPVRQRHLDGVLLILVAQLPVAARSVTVARPGRPRRRMLAGAAPRPRRTAASSASARSGPRRSERWSGRGPGAGRS